jgi:hypothetical protein
MHPPSWAKVNAVVDEGVVGIVSALSEFPQLETIESCERNEGNAAWVCFRYGEYWENPWRDLAEFLLGYMAPGLIAEVGDDVNVRIQVTASGKIFGEISIRPGAEHRVETALRKLAVGVIFCQPHKSGYSGGSSDTLPPHC